MADRELPPTRTPVLAADLYVVLRAAWRTLFGSEPARASLLTLLAQWSLETGGGAACIGYNLAGIKYTPGCGTDFASYTTQEVLGGKLVTIHPPDPGCRLRAYATLEDAASDYLRLLQRQFGFAWPAVVAGDPQDFAHRLKAAHYYTAPEQQYAAGLTSRYTMLSREIGEDTTPETPAAMVGFQPSVVLPDEAEEEPDPPSEPPDAAA